MGDIKWIHPTSECIDLLEHIKATYYTSIGNFMSNRYSATL